MKVIVIIFAFLVFKVSDGAVASEIIYGWKSLFDGYAEVEECRLDSKPFRVGKYVLKCNEEAYPYHYGRVILLKTQFTHNNRVYETYKLCFGLEESNCIDVDILRP